MIYPRLHVPVTMGKLTPGLGREWVTGKDWMCLQRLYAQPEAAFLVHTHDASLVSDPRILGNVLAGPPRPRRRVEVGET